MHWQHSSISCRTPWGAEPHILYDLPGRHHSLQPHGRGAPRAPACGVQEVLGVQFEAQAFEVLIFPVGNCVPGPSHLMEGHPTQSGEYVGHAGIPDARDLYAGPHILWTSEALQEVYQGVCQHSTPLV